MTNLKRITIQDIAHGVDASVEQVTRVMLGQSGVSDEVRRKVLAAMKEAGVMGVSREKTKGTLGVVIPGTTDGDYIAEVVRGITEAAAVQGYSIAFFSERNSKEHELIQMLEPGGCDGIIAIVPNNYQRLLELCHAYARSYVLVDHQGTTNSLKR